MREQKSPENRLTSPFRKLVTGNLSLQVMVTILAAILFAVLTNFLDDITAAAITSAIFIPAYVAMIYTFAWGVAERERNMVLYGHMQEDKGRGLRSGLWAAVPLVVCSIIVMILAYMGRGTTFIGIYRICTAPFLLFVNPLIEYAPFALPITAIFAPFASWWGYRNGYVLYRFWDHLIYKDGIKKRRNTQAKKGPRTRRH